MKNCPVCNKESRYIYCSLSCSNTSRLAKNEVRYLKTPKLCKGCESVIPYEKRFDNLFCSSSCSATFNNKKREKKTRRCKVCVSVLPKRGRSKSCSSCRSDGYLQKFGERNVSEFEFRYPRHRYQKIRFHAHRVAKSLGLPKVCFCGYSKHVELAHKISIGSFHKSAKLSEINSADNLVYLCPNHHWELDFDRPILVRV
jgi:hypothetical protein